MVSVSVVISPQWRPPPMQVLESSGLLDPKVGAFFFDSNLKLVDNLADEQVHY